MHYGTNPLVRSLSAAGLFVAILIAFYIFTIVSFAITLVPIFGTHLSAFFFDLIDYTFPVVCPTTCSPLPRGWYEYGSGVVWISVAIFYGIALRNRPLRYKVVVGLVTIPATILLMQLAIRVLGWTQFFDTF